MPPRRCGTRQWRCLRCIRLTRHSEAKRDSSLRHTLSPLSRTGASGHLTARLREAVLPLANFHASAPLQPCERRRSCEIAPWRALAGLPMQGFTAGSHCTIGDNELLHASWPWLTACCRQPPRRSAHVLQRSKAYSLRRPCSCPASAPKGPSGNCLVHQHSSSL